MHALAAAPNATAAQIRGAPVGSVTGVPSFAGSVASGGVLNRRKALAGLRP